MEPIKIGISACLLGQKVRYDGGHRYDSYLINTLGRYFEWIPVCPEAEYGLGIPREAMHLTGDPAAPRLVTIATGVDHTDGMLAWAEKRLEALREENLSGFIFKSGSPSSGMAAVKVYDAAGITVEKGVGLFAHALMCRFPHLPVEEDRGLHDSAACKSFLEKVRAYKHRRSLTNKKDAI